MEFSVEIYLLLTLLGFFAGFINAMAGGAGVLVLPVMLWCGIPPLPALATGKFQATLGTAASTWNYSRSGLLDSRLLWPLLLTAVLASGFGTWCVLQFSNAVLEKWLPYFLIIAALYVWFAPGLDDHDRPPKLSSRRFTLVVGPGIGFYGGFLGLNVGSIATLSFSTLLGYNLRRATANAKPLVIACNAASVLIFLFEGQVLFGVAIGMGVMQIFGAYAGSTIAIKNGAKVIRPVIAVMSVAIAVKLLLDAGFNS